MFSNKLSRLSISMNNVAAVEACFNAIFGVHGQWKQPRMLRVGIRSCHKPYSATAEARLLYIHPIPKYPALVHACPIQRIFKLSSLPCSTENVMWGPCALVALGKSSDDDVLEAARVKIVVRAKVSMCTVHR